ncbi:MAG: Dimethyladenosine transferase [Parcubacteria group bacterium GW2011_GWC1_42_11]|uniref:Ribosomal RNA small subunit methyltransferase A n=1 Tax=Candidatus Nomurabacteria bacterium GW2011_GWC2_42_20 TaxID=1618756 RepID=A0A0G0ZHU6_9BACT|nr:MAG: Dimethyladenosine transferase [Parcubacteria group bacterium GW2011_GWC1_42_11]KKS48244.1 MAG: Ribosomal RNA small subunit methyltransferase A [Candidatus Nomurabacteria bacterium GW2011_GWC2_42_20]KKT09817.1 MAG: Ribosomal RNA small subunit methyltransferase A [Candidatus Nomurabacteria bacterium GW2011_GWB1_43_20]TAN36280.1 MAG: ribosomal RNA small subunit methyltransferase A [Patescibacteria group bacterium]HBH71823.1 ribosomal RNA small subunit methyltransferase A [Candidatus Yonath
MVHAKKSLGQNFLNSKTVAKEIVRAGELSSVDTVLEIGPGKGFLTSELLASGAHVIAVEKDDRMIPLLSEKFADEIKNGKLTLLHGDILEKIEDGKIALPLRYKLVANIPYYLTGQIIRMFLEAELKPERMILMVQKEVATRIVARDKKESILSIAVKVYGSPHIIKKVPARYFTPAPKVDSAILSIENISAKSFQGPVSEKLFFDVVRAGFAHKRKVLAGNLKDLFGEKIISILEEVCVPTNARAEDLSLKNWLDITSMYQPQK